MTPSNLWENYIRYIGAGAVAAGGIISLVKSLPLIVRTFGKAMKGLFQKNSHTQTEVRTQRDISMKLVIPAVIAIIVLIWRCPFSRFRLSARWQLHCLVSFLQRCLHGWSAGRQQQ